MNFSLFCSFKALKTLCKYRGDSARQLSCTFVSPEKKDDIVIKQVGLAACNTFEQVGPVI